MKLTFLQEFKEFAIKGNMIDIAIGVIIGTAFNKVIDVLVKEIFLPPLTFLTNGISFENKKLILQELQQQESTVIQEEIAIGYGKLLEAGIDFLIIGLTVFLVVKIMNSIRKKADDPQNASETTPKNIELLHKLTELVAQQNEILKQNQNHPSSKK